MRNQNVKVVVEMSRMCMKAMCCKGMCCSMCCCYG